ncbi:hypothetical protein [Spirosoma rhododendri]|uniref:Uncharacterized protein n=1 Tax=Spirosoma rhododendri TaxID=2728024 RepID=A0A7L5DK15_9BACT|nr:hypothetical protein [Spirosoma rhododendri]QJD77812.1 hypothetical protein HH216_04760 [Spirosoma rhododendri]
MQGIHVINDPNGKPFVLTIDLHNLAPDAVPLVVGLLNLLEQQAEETDRPNWQAVSQTLLNQGSGTGEHI